MANLGVRMTNKRGTMSSLVMMVLVARVTRVVEGQADLLASVIEFSDYPDEIKFSEEYPDEDSDLMRRLDNGVPINVIQRPVTGLENHLTSQDMRVLCHSIVRSFVKSFIIMFLKCD